MAMRGRVQRRQGVKPPAREPVKRIPPGAPQYHGSGPVVVPSNGSVKILEFRFPAPGVIRSATLHIPDLPVDASVYAELWRGGVRQVSISISGEMTELADSLVDRDTVIRVMLSQESGRGPITVTPNIAYIYQEVPVD